MPAEQKLEFAERCSTNLTSCRLESCGIQNDQLPIKCTLYWKRLALRCASPMCSIRSAIIDGPMQIHMSSLELYRTTASITRRSSFTLNSKFGCISMMPMYKRWAVCCKNKTYFQNANLKSHISTLRLAQVSMPSLINAVVDAISLCYCFMPCHRSRHAIMEAINQMPPSPSPHQIVAQSLQVQRQKSDKL